MQRNPYLSLVIIAFLLFSLSPSDLAKASDTDVSVRAVPVSGHWTGSTSRGQPMSFDVSISGTQWSTFKLKTDFTIGSCSGTVEYTVPGPGDIINDAFSRSLSTFSFNGQFTSPAAASGNFAFTNEPVTGCGTFTQSGTWSATTTLPLPGAFSKFSPGDAATNQPANPTLSWGASTNATGYDYCYGTANPCSNWTDNGTVTSVALSGLTPAATYYWQVRARNGTGTTLADGGTFWSFSVTQVQFLRVYLPLVVKAPPLPGSFGKVAPANAATEQSTSPTLSWAASANTAGYEYCYGTSNPCSNWTDNGTATSKALTGLSLGTTYYWQVRARSAGGNTYADGGNWWSFTTAAPPSTFNAIADACIMQGYAGTNFGSTADMWAGYDDYLDPDGQIVRSLVKFDLSALSPGTSINSATLHLYYLGYYDYLDYSRTISTYGINSSWAEGSVTWDTQPAIGASYGSGSIVANTSWHWVSFDVTSLVRAWVDGSQANYGILIRGPEVSGSDSSWRSFGTRESGYVPYLSINDTGSASLTPSQPPFGSKVPDGLAKPILQILTGTSINPLGPVSCLNPLEFGNATKCLLVP